MVHHISYRRCIKAPGSFLSVLCLHKFRKEGKIFFNCKLLLAVGYGRFPYPVHILIYKMHAQHLRGFSLAIFSLTKTEIHQNSRKKERS